MILIVLLLVSFQAY
ncbi:type I toxin-antitoxin system Ibs family toxin [Escherichia coli]|nr:type I toxin-antitoxin system Ibs family toxin [Escherichia coli]MCN5825230.1 type I toxin-antitoxin system Ibs family toxin [Escherichia coli]MCN7226961.1 type I toxin-antitoxin system Ibs family toxin [Escherichia coli]MDB8187036.1 type I toxin-antitoxin system Ibs family toxin [Escherichia coli]MDB8202137.1 type I toxin-antitoxin system Ibs family toxin [Escherichia coli]MDB8221375.1 type I toxin-antitoxin system Ibs family toxin [Escherichia coli]